VSLRVKILAEPTPKQTKSVALSANQNKLISTKEHKIMTQTNKEETLSKATGTRAGTSEQGALKTIHRGYNKLNGYEAMLHIINRYRYVLYPFIFLSIIGSAYSFYNDYQQSFPMMNNYLKITMALFFSVMLEIVRDGSIIAIFNGKMKAPSRITIILIFLGVTGYLFSTHIKTKNIIEKSAIEYKLSHQDEKDISAKNPKYDIALQELKELKDDLANKKAEITPQLIKNTTSIYKAKRADAKTQKAELEKKIEIIKDKISKKRSEIIGYKSDNIQDVEQSQKLISGVLLATLLLVESLAMLGAVIKFIHKDNAQKEIAKHSEIIEEYESISEQMRKTNDDLGLMLSRDIEQAGVTNTAFIQAIAQNRQMFQSQMNEVLNAFANSQPINFTGMPMPQVQAKREEYQEEPKRQIGFKAPNKEQMLTALYADGTIAPSEKLAPKSLVVDVKKRVENQRLTDFYKELEQNDIVEFKRGLGYYAVADYQTALSTIREI